MAFIILVFSQTDLLWNWTSQPIYIYTTAYFVQHLCKDWKWGISMFPLQVNNWTERELTLALVGWFEAWSFFWVRNSIVSLLTKNFKQTNGQFFDNFFYPSIVLHLLALAFLLFSCCKERTIVFNGCSPDNVAKTLHFFIFYFCFFLVDGKESLTLYWWPWLYSIFINHFIPLIKPF